MRRRGRKAKGWLCFDTIDVIAGLDLLRSTSQPRRTTTTMVPMEDSFLQAAIEEARQGVREGGIPIGSVIVHSGKIVGRGHNRRVQRKSVILHGEMDALENAGRQPASVYRESVLYTTLSPCSMCSGAILLYGIPRVVVGENRTFMGEEELLRSRGISVEVLQNEECIRLMQDFIQQNPTLWNEDIGV
jgi:cytosine/creatinine deaminase